MGIKLNIPVSNLDHFQGPVDAPLVLVQFGDYQCPYCAMAYPIIKRLQLELGANLKFVFRNFPLTSVHPHALRAAKVAEAAAFQGKFWEMHDVLYDNRLDLQPESLARYAVGIGLDVNALLKAAAGLDIQERIGMEMKGGEVSGVTKTPTFFLNGIIFGEDWSYGPFLKFLRASLNPSRPNHRKVV